MNNRMLARLCIFIAIASISCGKLSFFAFDPLKIDVFAFWDRFGTKRMLFSRFLRRFRLKNEPKWNFSLINNFMVFTGSVRLGGLNYSRGCRRPTRFNVLATKQPLKLEKIPKSQFSSYKLPSNFFYDFFGVHYDFGRKMSKSRKIFSVTFLGSFSSFFHTQISLVFRPHTSTKTLQPNCKTLLATCWNDVLRFVYIIF